MSSPKSSSRLDSYRSSGEYAQVVELLRTVHGRVQGGASGRSLSAVSLRELKKALSTFLAEARVATPSVVGTSSIRRKDYSVTAESGPKTREDREKLAQARVTANKRRRDEARFKKFHS